MLCLAGASCIISVMSFSPEYIDIHSHIQFSAYDEDRAEVVARMRREKIAAIVVGTDAETSAQAVRLAEKNEHLYASIGLHPNEAQKESFNDEFYRNLLSDGKVVAVGECGLDYFRTEGTLANKKTQRELFARHIALAAEADKPLMIHCRPSAGTMDAYEDALAILSDEIAERGERVRGNVHFFVGTPEIAEKFFALGFSVSFTGVITFARDYDDTLRRAPLERIMAETDCPFVAPVPFRGKRNEPAYVKEVVKKIAEVRGEDFEQVRSALADNARNMFRI